MSTVWLSLMGVPFAQKYYNAGGIKTRSVEAGDGDPLILLHGIGGHAETYVHNLEAHAQYFRTMSIDMISHGFSDKPDMPYTIPVYVGRS